MDSITIMTDDAVTILIQRRLEKMGISMHMVPIRSTSEGGLYIDVEDYLRFVDACSSILVADPAVLALMNTSEPEIEH